MACWRRDGGVSGWNFLIPSDKECRRNPVGDVVAKIKISLPDGSSVDATEVGVEETTERWSEVRLSDGTKLRVKMTVVSADTGDRIVIFTGFSITCVAHRGLRWTRAVSARSTPAGTHAELDWYKFHLLADQWKKNRKQTSSFTHEILTEPNYLHIIGMGPAAIPCILRQLESEMTEGEPDHWFPALWAITQENPIPAESRGKIFEMAKAWLDWGRRAGYATVGVGLSSPW